MELTTDYQVITYNYTTTTDLDFDLDTNLSLLSCEPTTVGFKNIKVISFKFKCIGHNSLYILYEL